jgi:hypothetical protein
MLWKQFVAIFTNFEPKVFVGINNIGHWKQQSDKYFWGFPRSKNVAPQTSLWHRQF